MYLVEYLPLLSTVSHHFTFLLLLCGVLFILAVIELNKNNAKLYSRVVYGVCISLGMGFPDRAL